MASEQQDVKDYDKKRKGMVGSTISFIFYLFLTLLGSLFINIIIEWIGMAFWWPNEPHHAQGMVIAELNYLEDTIGQHPFFGDTKGFVMHQASAIYQVVVIESGLQGLLSQRHQLFGNIESLYNEYASDASLFGEVNLQSASSTGQTYIESALSSTQLFVVRLLILTLSIPAVLLAILIGMTDGIVERDLRKWGGGRESSMVFSFAKSFFKPVIFIFTMLYLSLPVTVSPFFIFVPFAISLGLVVRKLFEKMKKYL
ncbi:TIGR03747 family integrating conjugative element membrane protein [Endozoicomonas sp. SM1973]|uniref:TIGR03747 family integrating conjugative element membrane protein n=1 Tax=Spartinivicinus marinus TaxID=2994442 RepID=A0A853IB23_9GAMM|nr:TIGR03747 family integrating conjugative element membrane protein [Spartinivicinus marinus]MCX4030185.1 TIGR03747 family integrating conjugative element membrane protein [Spartinivicinus marinus]NYZ67828.1 TIGR03747 family integrating conjugative element membrane protein [Spartinivicinus marinus]